jgi:hypothetical protein
MKPTTDLFDALWPIELDSVLKKLVDGQRSTARADTSVEQGKGKILVADKSTAENSCNHE